MSNIRSFSLSEEDEELFEEFKNKNPGLSLSSFIRSKVKEELDKSEIEDKNREGIVKYMLTECFGIKDQKIIEEILEEWRKAIKERIHYKGENQDQLNGNSMRSQTRRSLWIGEQALKYGYNYIPIEERKNLVKELLEENDKTMS